MMDENENNDQVTSDGQGGDTQNIEQGGSVEKEDHQDSEKPVPYWRFKELIEDRNQFKTEVAVLRDRVERMNQQNARPQEFDDRDIDDNTKKYVKHVENKFISALGNVFYENEKLKHIIREPGLSKYEKEIDDYCKSYAQKYGSPPAVESAVEIVKARHQDELRKKKTVSQPQTQTQTTTTPARPKVPSATNSITPPKAQKKGLLNIPL